MPVVAASSAVSIVARAGLASATGRGVSRARAPRLKPSAAADTPGVVVARSTAFSSVPSPRRRTASSSPSAFASRSVREMTAVNAAAVVSSSSSAAADDALFLGLDFGTTNTVAALSGGGDDSQLISFDGEDSTGEIFRSALCFWEEGSGPNGIASEAGPWAITEISSVAARQPFCAIVQDCCRKCDI